MNNLEISICIPTFNGERYLEETIISVISQNIAVDHEILIIDDGSTDSTIDIVEKFVASNSKIRFIKNISNLGLVGNWNKCLELAKGDWIYFLFQDDQIMPEAMECIINCIKENETKFILFDREYFGDDPDMQSDLQDLPRLSDWFSDEKVSIERMRDKVEACFIHRNFLGEPVCGVFHRSVLSDFGYFDENMVQLVDFDFWLRLAANTPFYFIDKKLVRFRVHNNSASSSNLKKGLLQVYVKDRLVLSEKVFGDQRYEALNTKMFSEQFESFLLLYAKKFGIRDLNKVVCNLAQVNYRFKMMIRKYPSLYWLTLKREIKKLAFI